MGLLIFTFLCLGMKGLSEGRGMSQDKYGYPTLIPHSYQIINTTSEVNFDVSNSFLSPNPSNLRGEKCYEGEER